MTSSFLALFRDSRCLNELVSKPLVSLFVLLSFSACLDTGSLVNKSAAPASTFSGCTSGSPIDNSSVMINFELPTKASRMVVMRNGVEVGSIPAGSGTSFIDTGLIEGQAYSYECHAFEGNRKIVGVNSLTLSPVNSNAPVFLGVATASALSPRSAQVTWKPASPTGPRTAKYQIYANPGSTVNWDLVPRATVASGTFLHVLSDLGDELTYSFGVRACTAENICDTNTVLVSKTLADGGAPQTSGISEALARNGQITLTAPWVEANGAVKKRYVYKRVGATGGTNLADYSLEQTVIVSNLAAPQTSIVIPGIMDYTSYHFILIDEDPSGNKSSQLNVVSLNSGDTTAPIFSGFSGLSAGNPKDTVVVGEFTAIPRQGFEGPSGTYEYIVYSLSATFPSVPGNACTSGTESQIFSAASYIPGVSTVNISSLQPRTSYSFCLKARDQAGNISNNTAALWIVTQDITAPIFDGLQTFLFDSNDSKIYLTWNSASSSDVSQYKIRMWKNTATPAANQITTFFRSAMSASLGTSFANTEFTYANLDTVYAVVDACDDAQTISGGTQNCTSATIASAKSVVLPAFQPPAGFTGIKPAGNQVSTVEGQATIHWYAPATWTADYSGFKIYSVNPTTNALTALKSCACAVPGSCNAADTSCTITDLNPGRTYRFHVRAYNSGNFESTYLDPVINYADKKVADTTFPTFSSGLTLGASPTYTLYWASASDNHYTGDGAVIMYKIYRKPFSTFADPFNPSADGVLVTTTSSTAYTDSGWLDGTDYFYGICALDSSSNTTCDGTVKKVSITDVTPPTITSFTSLKQTQTALKRWDLNWTFADNTTPNSLLRVRIYRSITDAASIPVIGSGDTSIVLDSTGDITLSNDTGPMNQNKYVNYLLWVQDQAGNVVTSSMSLKSENIVSLTGVTRSTGTTGGGQVVVIEGTGFSKGSDNGYGINTQITFGGSVCTSSTVVSSTLMSCVTPTGINGPSQVIAANPEGSSDLDAGLFTYLAVSTHVCDNPANWDSTLDSTQGMAAGTGTTMDPFIVCSADHLSNMKGRISDGWAFEYEDGGFTYNLMANIDLAGVTFEAIGGDTNNRTFSGNFDGGNYAILNWTRTTVSPDLALFGKASTINVSNLRLLNLNLTGLRSIAGIVGTSSGPTTISNVLVEGTFTATQSSFSGVGSSGGIVGNKTSSSDLEISDSEVNVKITGNTDHVGGIVGRFNGNNSGKLTLSNIKATVELNCNNNVMGIATAANKAELTDVFVKGTADGATATTGGLQFAAVAGAALDLKLTRVGVEVDLNRNGGTGAFVVGFLRNAGNVVVTPAEVLIEQSFYRGSINVASETNSYSSMFNENRYFPITYSISNSYVTGDITSGGNFSGALRNSAAGDVYNVDKMYVATDVVGPAANNGVLYNVGTANFTNSFWDYQYSGLSTGQSGAPSITAKTTAQMKDQTTNIYEAAGWDFTPITGKWKWCGAGTYPRLMWETCP